MKWKEFLKSGVAVVQELENSDLENPQKLEVLTNKVGVFMENVDDLVEFLPIGFGFIAKLLVDNPIADSLQREYVHKPLAETLVQAWKTANATGGDVASYTEGVVALGGSPLTSE